MITLFYLGTHPIDINGITDNTSNMGMCRSGTFSLTILAHAPLCKIHIRRYPLDPRPPWGWCSWLCFRTVYSLLCCSIEMMNMGFSFWVPHHFNCLRWVLVSFYTKRLMTPSVQNICVTESSVKPLSENTFMMSCSSNHESYS